MKIKNKKYKLKCAFCGKVVSRKTRLRKPVCDKCKQRGYIKKGPKTKKARNDVIFHLSKKGFSDREIGEMFDISRQRVGQIKKIYKKKGGKK